MSNSESCPSRGLGTVRGELGDLLTDPVHESLTDRFLSVVLTDRVRPLDAMRRLRTRFPHALHMEWLPEGGHVRPRRYAEATRGRPDEEVACCFVADTRGAEPSESERGLLREALAAVAGTEPE